jgi:hypothetical protein
LATTVGEFVGKRGAKLRDDVAARRPTLDRKGRSSSNLFGSDSQRSTDIALDQRHMARIGSARFEMIDDRGLVYRVRRPGMPGRRIDQLDASGCEDGVDEGGAGQTAITRCRPKPSIDVESTRETKPIVEDISLLTPTPNQAAQITHDARLDLVRNQRDPGSYWSLRVIQEALMVSEMKSRRRPISSLVD